MKKDIFRIIIITALTTLAAIVLFNYITETMIWDIL